MERNKGKIQVVIAVKTRIYREGIGQMLSSDDGIEVLDMISDERQVLTACQHHQGAGAQLVVLIDASMQHSLTLIRQLNACDGKIRIVVLAMSACRNQMAKFAAEGVVEFVTHEDSSRDLKRCIYAAFEEGFWCSKRVAHLLLSRPVNTSVDTPQRRQEDSLLKFDGLSNQQVNVLKLIESGMSNKEIGRRLNIETATVKNHVHHILQKLKVSNRGEAAARFRRNFHSASLA